MISDTKARAAEILRIAEARSRKTNGKAGNTADGAEPWRELLHLTDRGSIRDILQNVVIVLTSEEQLQGRLRWNEMLGAVEAKDVPWRKGSRWQEWTDADDLCLASWCQERRVYVKVRTCADAAQLVARDQPHHPVRERLNGLVWDGKPRLDTWLSTYLGVADTAYTRAVGRAWPVSAVARVFRPGCKCDHALILEGPQGIGKSTAARLLALEDAWFADEISDLGSKDSAQDLRGKWVVELAELSAMRRGEVERVKAFISRPVDHYRPSYGTRSQDYPRQCVFVGSTNADAYLSDETGGRRFWPVAVGRIRTEALSRDVEQLLAEAVVAYRNGEQWWLGADQEREAREEQADRRVADPWEQPVLEWLVGKLEASVAEVLRHAVNMPVERHDQAAMNRVARILRVTGWKQVQRRVRGTRFRFYVRPTEADTRDSGPEPVTTRDGKPSNSAGVTDVTGVTGMFRTQESAGHGACAIGFGETSRDIRDTRDSGRNTGFSVTGGRSDTRDTGGKRAPLSGVPPLAGATTANCGRCKLPRPLDADWLCEDCRP
jgi:predicted P-loop ATPase